MDLRLNGLGHRPLFLTWDFAHAFPVAFSSFGAGGGGRQSHFKHVSSEKMEELSVSADVTAAPALLAAPSSHRPLSSLPEVVILLLSPPPSSSSPRLVSSPLQHTYKLVWLKRSIAADLYMFSASDAKVPWKRREYKQSWMPAPRRLPPPASHSFTSIPMNRVFSQGRTECSQAGCSSTDFPAKAPELGTHIHARHPVEAIRSMSPRRVRWMEA